MRLLISMFLIFGLGANALASDDTPVNLDSKLKAYVSKSLDNVFDRIRIENSECNSVRCWSYEGAIEKETLRCTGDYSDETSQVVGVCTVRAWFENATDLLVLIKVHPNAEIYANRIEVETMLLHMD